MFTETWRPWRKTSPEFLVRYVNHDAARGTVPQDFFNVASGATIEDLRREGKLSEIVQLLYIKLCTLGIEYDREPVSMDDPANMDQRIRRPDEIITQRRGTCLDLALLFASLCIEVHLLPMIVLLQQANSAHALVVVDVQYSMDKKDDPRGWKQNDRLNGWIRGVGRLWQVSGDFATRIDDGFYIPVECTGIGRSQAHGSSEGFLSFADACRKAKENLNQMTDVATLDVVRMQSLKGYTPYDLREDSGLSSVRIEEIIREYRENLHKFVNRVRLLGEAGFASLEKVFVLPTLTRLAHRHFQNSSHLSMMSVELRQRRTAFLREEGGGLSPGSSEESDSEQRTLRPDDLLRAGGRFVVLGAPGYGKTTVLKYLALKLLRERPKTLPIFLELKSLTGRSFSTAEGDFVTLLTTQGFGSFLQMLADEQRALRQHIISQLRSGQVAIFLDGLDEISNKEFFEDLLRLLESFSRSVHPNNTVILSTRPYALQRRLEEFSEEAEINDLTPTQIRIFLKNYYGTDQGVKKLSQDLTQEGKWHELSRSPALLGPLARILKEQVPTIETALDVYDRLIQWLVVKLDREKGVTRFQISDPVGSLKRRFLKELAFSLFFQDHVTEDVSLVVFSYETIEQRVQDYCRKEGIQEDFSKLAKDVVATPLLREVGDEKYTFIHLTIQEFLAAQCLVEHPDRLMFFARAYFHLTLSETEMLPMAVGMDSKSPSVRELIKELPESLVWTNLRLRGRSLRYLRSSPDDYLEPLKETLINTLLLEPYEFGPFSHSVYTSFRGAPDRAVKSINEAICKLLLHPNSTIRRKAIFSFGQLGISASVESLVACLNDSDEQVQRLAAESLGRLGDPAAVAPLTIVLTNANRHLRRAAAVALGRIGDSAAVGSLLACLSDSDGHLRTAAATALGNLGDPETVGPLVNALTDSNTHLRQAAAKALRQLDTTTAILPLLTALTDSSCLVRQSAVKALGELRDQAAVPPLVAALSDPNDSVRWATAQSLGMLGDAAAVPPLVVALTDSDSRVRLGAAMALGELGDQAAVTPLVAALSDPDNRVRWVTAQSLGMLGDAAAVSPLVVALTDSDSQVRASAAMALGTLGYQTAVVPLVTALSDPDKNVRRGAASALGDLGDPIALAPLRIALTDPDSILRVGAVRSLGLLRNPAALSSLVTALSDPEDMVRRQAANTLGELGDTTAVLPLVAALSDSDITVKNAAARALGLLGGPAAVAALTASLTDFDGDLKSLAAETLGRLGDQTAVPPLLNALLDPDLDVQFTAAVALSRLGNPAAVVQFIDALTNPDPSVLYGDATFELSQELFNLNREVMREGLINTLSHQEGRVRSKALRVLGYYAHDRDLIVLLSKIARSDKAKEIRTIAKDTLNQIQTKLKLLGTN